MDDGTEQTPSKFADDMKLGGMVGALDRCAAIQRDLNKLENWAVRNFMKFSKRNYQVLHLGGTTPVASTVQGTTSWKAA